MTIQERLKRSNLIMLVVSIVIAGVLLAAGLGFLVLLLEHIYLPQLGLTLRDVHNMGEELEPVFKGLKLFIVLYAAVVLAALLAAVVFTNLYLTRALFAHIQQPLNAMVQGVQRIQDGDLDTPIAYTEPDEFRPACDAALHQPFDLLILDVMLPGVDGFTICRQVRAVKDIPILIVTARGEDVDKIRGLGFGADDYIEKPFSPSVLVARVKANLAQYARLKPSAASTPPRITVGPLTADPATRTVTKNGVEISLKNKEYELLLFLMRHPEQVFSREDLYEIIWGLESMGDNITVAVHINRLREKIEDVPSEPKLLQTVWGVGYRLHAV